MNLSNKQRRALDRILSFGPGNFNPSEQAIEWFFNWSDSGLRTKFEDSQDYRDLSEILIAHHLMSGAQENLWLEGHLSGDYPLGCVIRDLITEIGEDIYIFGRKRELFRRLVILWYNLYKKYQIS